jgi:hypothetical protein
MVEIYNDVSSIEELIEKHNEIYLYGAGASCRLLLMSYWQENMDYEYPLRDLKYETAEYDRQLRKIAKTVRKNRVGLSPGEYLYGFRKSDKLKPVVTFVLYSGEEPWTVRRVCGICLILRIFLSPWQSLFRIIK